MYLPFMRTIRILYGLRIWSWPHVCLFHGGETVSWSWFVRFVSQTIQNPQSEPSTVWRLRSLLKLIWVTVWTNHHVEAKVLTDVKTTVWQTPREVKSFLRIPQFEPNTLLRLKSSLTLFRVATCEVQNSVWANLVVVFTVEISKRNLYWKIQVSRRGEILNDNFMWQ